MQQKTIGFIGAGNMGQCIIRGLLAAKLQFKTILLSNKSIESSNRVADKYQVTATDNAKICSQADIVLLGVKPQQITPILEQQQQALEQNNPLIISVAAGVSCKTMQQALNYKPQIVRAMPNTPAQIGQAITSLFAMPATTAENKTISATIMQAIGSIIWLDQEAKLHVATAVAGSGPAYFFEFCNALIHAGINLGLSEAEATSLSLKTAAGACNLANNSEHSITELIASVTSPNGTTAAALKNLQQHKFAEIILNAVTAATERSIELDKIRE